MECTLISVQQVYTYTMPNGVATIVKDEDGVVLRVTIIREDGECYPDHVKDGFSTHQEAESYLACLSLSTFK